jgi:hypothetical protein
MRQFMIGARQLDQRAAHPVGPGGIAAQLRRHRLDGGGDHLPVPLAQRDAGLPLQLFLRQRRAGAALPVAVRFRRQGHRRGVGDAGPAGRLFLGAQLRGVLLQRDGGQLDAGARHAADRDQVDFVFDAAGADAARHRQRRHVDRLRGARVGGAEQHRGAARRTGGVLFAGQAQLRQQVVGGELAGLRQRGDQRRTGFAVAGRIDQEVAGVGGDFFALDRARHQAVALDLGVVVQHEQRQLLVEVDPVAVASQFEQPVVAHAVGDGAALVAREEFEHFARLRFAQARFEPIIVDIRRDSVLRQAGGVSGGGGGVVLARRFAQQQEQFVVGAHLRDHGRAVRRGRRRRQAGSGEDGDNDQFRRKKHQSLLSFYLHSSP